MSLGDNKLLFQEPYYQDFIDNGYKYLGHGYMHIVFEKDDKIYKILKSRFSAQDSMEKFVFEAKNLNFLRKFGLPTAKVLCIKKPGELIDNFHVLVEHKISGNVPDRNDVQAYQIYGIHNVLNSTHKIPVSQFGPIGDTGLQKPTWCEYMEYLVDRASFIADLLHLNMNMEYVKEYFKTCYVYRETPKFIILDPNERNYIFDQNKQLAGIIDIDHPLGFDPLYEYAAYLYSRPQQFFLMNKLGLIDKKSMHTIRKYAIIYSLYDTWFRYEKNQFRINDKIEFYINQVKNFIKNQGESRWL